jgi:hypothetical protein
MKYKNTTGHNVFLDLGGFILVRPNEIVELEGNPTFAPLTAVQDPLPAAPKAKKATPKKKTKAPSVSGTI